MITNFETTNVLNAQIMGLSTDTKPTTGVQPNSLFWELDTNGMYFFDGTQWQSIGGSGGGGGEGGESDFSTAEVTIVNEASDNFVLKIPNLFDDILETTLDSDDIDGPITVVLYKDQCVFNYTSDIDLTIKIDGEDTDIITGNCTMTITDTPSGT